MSNTNKNSGKFRNFFKKGSIKISDIKGKTSLNLFNSFSHKNQKSGPKVANLGDIQKGRGLSTFQDKFSVGKAVSTISAPIYASKKVVKAVAKEGARFSVAIFDNSPGPIKSWVRGFSGYGLAAHAAKERFDSLPEVVKVKARRSMFEIGILFFLAFVAGLSVGIYYIVHVPTVVQTVYTSPQTNPVTTWQQNSSFPDSNSNCFTLTLSKSSFENFNRNSYRKDFYIKNFYNVGNKDGTDVKGFWFTGVDVPSLGVDLTDVRSQNNNKLQTPYTAPQNIEGAYKDYTPSTPTNDTSGHFVKYTTRNQINKVIRRNVGGEDSAVNSADDTYRNALMKAFVPSQNTSFALYTLSSYDKSTKIYSPLTLSFTTGNSPIIQENVSIIVTNCSPSTRTDENDPNAFVAQIILTNPIKTQDKSSSNYQKNFGGVAFVNKNSFGNQQSSAEWFSQSLTFSNKA